MRQPAIPPRGGLLVAARFADFDSRTDACLGDIREPPPHLHQRPDWDLFPRSSFPLRRPPLVTIGTAALFPGDSQVRVPIGRSRQSSADGKVELKGTG